jgi:hypothetical protein
METGTPGWFERRVKRWYDRDHEKPGERFGELFATVLILLVTLYFIYSQVLQTGFFTSSFGSVEMFLFYAPVPLGIGVNTIRLTTGRRNPARPLETLDAILIAVAGLWLFVVFPFNFAHLADLLPNFLQFLLSWIPNYLGRAIVLIAGLGGLFNSVYTPLVYFSVRREYSKRASLVG